MRYIYQHFDRREYANEIARNKVAGDLFRELILRNGGDVQEALDFIRDLNAAQRRSLPFAPGEFERLLRAQGLIQDRQGRPSLAPKGERFLRSSCMEEMFGRPRKGSPGNHVLRRPGASGEAADELRPWQPGDDSVDIDYRESLGLALKRGHGTIEDDDLLVRGREATTSAATVMLLDISHSMTLYGEDRITPAKKVALAFAELQQRFHPKDSLTILLFGDDVTEVSVRDLPFVTNGPYHTNTCEALRRAAEILAKKRQANRRVVMITDGKPTALLRRGQLMINSAGLDPEIVTATLNQGARYPRLKIDLTIFMVASDPWLERFVEQLVEVSRGRAFRTSLEGLGEKLFGRFFRA